MSYYSDLYVEALQENKESWLETLKSDDEGLKKFKDIFIEEIHDFDSEGPDFDFNVIAADAGRNSKEFKNKSNLIVSRAAAVDDQGNNSRKILADMVKVYSRNSFEDLRDRSSESLEIDCIKELLNSQDSSETYILIDGSLLTRCLVLPSEFNISKHQDYVLNLIENISEIFEYAKQNDNVNLVGVSKDSNTDIFFSTVILEELKKLLSKREIDKQAEIIRKIRKSRNNPKRLKTIRKDLKEVLPGDSKVFGLLDLLENPRVDTEIIETLYENQCFTTPIETGMVSQKLKTRLEYYRKDKDNYIEEYFAKTLENDNRGKEEIKEVIDKILELSTTSTLYWKPENKAQPLRIDIPTFQLQENHETLGEFEGSRVLEVDDKIKDVLTILNKGYGGETMHNVWISEADEIAGLSNHELETVFLPLMSQKLGINLRDFYRRRDKRV